MIKLEFVVKGMISFDNLFPSFFFSKSENGEYKNTLKTCFDLDINLAVEK